MYKIDYNVNRTKDCVLIDTTNWIDNSSNILKQYKMSGKKVITYIAEVLEVNIVEENFKGFVNKGDTVLLSRVASEVSQYKAYALTDGDKKYFDVPFMQILGVFRGNETSLGSLDLLSNKVLFEKETITTGPLNTLDQAETVGRVLKVGKHGFSRNGIKKPLTVKEGDLVVVKDNVSTKVTFNGKDYYVVEENSIVCILNKDRKDMETANFINESILVSPYVPEKLSEHLWTPNLDYENEDYSTIYNRDRFIINFLDSNLTELKKNDIIWLNRNVTTYVFFNGNRYFLLNGKENIDCKEIDGGN